MLKKIKNNKEEIQSSQLSDESEWEGIMCDCPDCPDCGGDGKVEIPCQDNGCDCQVCCGYPK